jgi:NTP pyrophosphatase (non-canonical NTP hydrolase)
MNNEQYLLGKLAEEAAELAQIAIKAQQFGLAHVFGGSGNPDILSNLQRIEDEYNDIVGIVAMLEAEENVEINVITDKVVEKVKKTAKWRDIAKEVRNET